MMFTATDSVSVSTVLLSVLSSATVGGIVVAVLTGRHERDQQLRDKMLEAAASFATSIAKLRAHLQVIDDPEESIGGARDKALAEYAMLWEQASAELVQIQMLYHPRSKVSVEASKIWQRVPSPGRARQFPGEPAARQKAMLGRSLTAEDIRYASSFSGWFSQHVWEAVDNPRGKRGRRFGSAGRRDTGRGWLKRHRR